MPDMTIPGTDVKIPSWGVYAIGAVGVGVIVYATMKGRSSSSSALQPSTAGIDNAQLAQNFDELRQQLQDYINTQLGTATNTVSPTPTPAPVTAPPPTPIPGPGQRFIPPPQPGGSPGATPGGKSGGNPGATPGTSGVPGLTGNTGTPGFSGVVIGSNGLPQVFHRTHINPGAEGDITAYPNAASETYTANGVIQTGGGIGISSTPVHVNPGAEGVIIKQAPAPHPTYQPPPPQSTIYTHQTKPPEPAKKTAIPRTPKPAYKAPPPQSTAYTHQTKPPVSIASARTNRGARGYYGGDETAINPVGMSMLAGQTATLPDISSLNGDLSILRVMLPSDPQYPPIIVRSK